MANKSEKRRYENNRRRLNRLACAILFANVAANEPTQLATELKEVWRLGSAFWFNYCVLVLCNVVYFSCYGILRKAATPQYSASKELISGGTDLTMSGFVEYVTDAILLTVLIQVLGGLTDWAWILVLIAPGYGLYVAWGYYSRFTEAQQQQMENMGLGNRADRARRRMDRRHTRGH